MNIVPFGFRAERIRELNRTVYRPYIELELKTSAGGWIRVALLVDSGADYILLPRSACEAAGYNWEAGKEFKLGGISRKAECKIIVRHQEVMVRIGGNAFPVPVAFAEIEGVPQLLGREGVFNRFDVAFKQRSQTGEFLP
ncbi:MAG: hypothetical protein HYU39_00235 [Thaumarchaeota archaeon]|nr:hypothetical protein [Nitrososphaerota archaeon]